MNTEKSTERYVAFLRGINVGGHHKVPMADLRKKLEEMGFQHVVTLLNSGNIIFDAKTNNPEELEDLIARNLEITFGFPVPAIVRRAEMIGQLFNEDPFRDIEVTQDIRLYVSFLRKNTTSDPELPWTSEDNSYRILGKSDNTILSVLDLSISKTPDAMKALETFFGKDITTRNWKTIERVVKKL